MFVRPCYPNSRNLKSPLTFPMRFIGGSFLCQRHNDPAVSLLKTAISGSETLIFQIGRLTVSGGISLGHVILHHCQGGAWAKQAISRLASQKIQKKSSFPWQKSHCFLQLTGTLIPSYQPFIQFTFENQPSSYKMGPLKNLSEDFGQRRQAILRIPTVSFVIIFFPITQRIQALQRKLAVKKNIIHKELERWLSLKSSYCS